MAEILYNNKCNGGVAQLGERLVRIQEVMGSNPTVSTIDSTRLGQLFVRALFFGGALFQQPMQGNRR